MSKKRILYLSNHVTLSKFEIPMLQKMGYEVYMPKKPAFDISCRVDWELDKTLSIPQLDLNILNEIDFYYEPLNEQQVAVLNQYFDIAFFVAISQMVKNIIYHFDGVICFRAFGIGAAWNYTEYFTEIFGTAIWSQLRKLGTRFWFGSGYESIIDSEKDFLKDKSLFMPLGFPNAVVNDRWVGGGKRLLFPCPKINTVPYFKNTYNDFKKNFKDIPYTISGVQPIPVKEDQNVRGYLSDEEYVKLHTTASCMFYYSKYKTHVHYTPFEAVCWGLPLLYLEGGLIDTIGGEDLPGRCKDINEVRRKAKRLVNGDMRLAQKLRESQAVLLDVFTEEYCLKHWEKAMKILESQIPERVNEPITISVHQKKRIGVVLPISHTDGILQGAINLIKALVLGAQENKDNVEFVFAYDKFDGGISNQYLLQIKILGVMVRTFEWEKLSQSQLNTFSALQGTFVDVVPMNRFVPNDGNSYFRDCDFLIFADGNVPNPTFIPIPYAVMIHHYAQRIFPQICSLETDNGFLAFCRNSTCSIMLPTVKEHAIQYGLLPKEQIYEIPILVDKISFCSNMCAESNSDKKYFVWATSSSSNQKHKMILSALLNYYLGGGKYKCYIVGKDTNAFQKSFTGTLDEYQQEIRRILFTKLPLKKNLVVLGDLKDQEYISALKQASFVLYSDITDINAYTCFNAAYLGVPTLSSDYLSMKYIDKYFNLGMKFFSSTDENILTNLLFETESDLLQWKNRLPSQVDLNSLTVSSSEIYSKLYSIFKFNISF